MAPNKYGANQVNEFYKSKGVTKNNFSLSVISEDDVKKMLNKTCSSKATGVDKIPAKFVKDGAEQISLPISHLVNLSIHTNKIPSDLKSARVVPIYKKGSKTDPGNYRPVSVLSIISKVLERAVYNQLNNYFAENNLIYELQSGFRDKYSTDTCLIYLTDHIRFQTNSGNYTGMALLDLQKAFDTVDHQILLDKLHAMGVADASVGWFRSYLCDR